MSDDSLARVRRATRERKKVQAEWHQAIRDAHATGISTRAISEVVGLTHVRVFQLIQKDPPRTDPEYARFHRAVEKARGKPKECSHCGISDSEKMYDWANLTGNYADVEDYARLCRKCHRDLDRQRRIAAAQA